MILQGPELHKQFELSRLTIGRAETELVEAKSAHKVKSDHHWTVGAAAAVAIAGLIANFAPPLPRSVVVVVVVVVVQPGESTAGH